MRAAPFYRTLAPFRFWWGLGRPTDWAAELGRDAPLHVEIGCGNGDWFARQAAEHPDRNHVGFELEWGRIAKILRKLSQLDHAHTALLQLDADQALLRCFAPESVTAITCHFPEPWPKRRHAKYRLFSAHALRCAASRLRAGGALRIVTDHGPYADWIAAQVPDCLALERGRVGASHGTWFERTWTDLGHRDFDELRLTKVAHPNVPIPEEPDMETHRLDAFDAARFDPLDVRGRPDAGETAVVFKERLYDPERRCAMVRATVAEPDLVQHLWVQVVEQDGHWHVRPAEATGFVPTRGVQLLLDTVRDAVRGSAPDER